MMVRVGTAGVKITPRRGMVCEGCTCAGAIGAPVRLVPGLALEADCGVDGAVGVVEFICEAPGGRSGCGAEFAKLAIGKVSATSVATVVKMPVVKMPCPDITDRGGRLNRASTQLTLKLIFLKLIFG